MEKIKKLIRKNTYLLWVSSTKNMDKIHFELFNNIDGDSNIHTIENELLDILRNEQDGLNSGIEDSIGYKTIIWN